EPDSRLPPQLRSRSRRIRSDRPWISRTDEVGIDDDRRPAGLGEAGCPTERIVTVERPRELEPTERESPVDELPHVVELAGAEHVVTVRRGVVTRLAEDGDHPVDVVRREPPVALDLQVAERERLRRAAVAQVANVIDDLARKELQPAAVRLVVE